MRSPHEQEGDRGGPRRGLRRMPVTLRVTCGRAGAAIQNVSTRGSSSAAWMVAPASLPSSAQR